MQQRRRLLETTLECMSMFDDVEGMLQEESLQSTRIGANASVSPIIGDEIFVEKSAGMIRNRRDLMR